MAVQAFLMTCHDTKIADAWIRQAIASQNKAAQHLRRKIGLAALSSAKGLFILALDHDLSLGGHCLLAAGLRAGSSNQRQFAHRPLVDTTEIRGLQSAVNAVWPSCPRVARACSLSSSEQGQVEEYT